LACFGLSEYLAYSADLPYSQEVECVASVASNEDIGEKERVPGTTKFQVYWVHQIRAQFGCLPDTGANRIMVAEWLRKELLAAGVRPSHVSLHVPIVVIASMTPLDSDIHAARLASSRARQARIRAAAPVAI